MKIIGILTFLFGIMLQAPGEHWQNYVVMAAGVVMVLAGCKLERG